jgi:transposase-like protein
VEYTKEPATLQEATLYFSSPDNCHKYLIGRRWPDGIRCPRCGGETVKFQPKHSRWQCAGHHERRQFTLKTGTIFEDSPIGLDKWLAVTWQVVNCKNGISSYEVHRTIGVTQKTAWFMDHRIRLALGISQSGKVQANGSILKRDASGRNISGEPFHPFLYLNEQAFRYNHREGLKGGDRFDPAIRQSAGKRLAFDQLTGKNQPGVFLN